VARRCQWHAESLCYKISNVDLGNHDQAGGGTELSASGTVARVNLNLLLFKISNVDIGNHDSDPSPSH
jgi:hypothetical protein